MDNVNCECCDGTVEAARVELLNSTICSKCAPQQKVRRVRADIDDSGSISVVRGEVYGSYRGLAAAMASSDPSNPAGKALAELIS